EPCSCSRGAGRFRRERPSAGGPIEGEVHRRELFYGRAAGDRGEGDARVYRDLQGQAGLGADDGDGLPQRVHRDGGAYTARGEEPAQGRHLRRVRQGPPTRGPDRRHRRHPAGRDRLLHYPGSSIRPGGPLRRGPRRPPRGGGCRAADVRRPDSLLGPLLRPDGEPGEAVGEPRGAGGGDGGCGHLHDSGDAPRAGRLPAHGLGHHRRRGGQDRRRGAARRRGQHDGAGAGHP
ncbi:MAG: Purine nucleoside phosphorylase, partial [uncultured Rubrobacteraceae bacterium]